MDANDESALQIVPMGNFFHLKLVVPSNVIGWMIGTGGRKRKEIQRQTETLLQFPDKSSAGTTSATVKITGESRESVVAAHDLIAGIVSKFGGHQQQQHDELTHFVSVPVAEPDIQERFLQFKEAVLGESAAPTNDLVPSMFAKSHRLHLTFGVLSLADDEQRQQAVDLLLECQEQVVQPILRAHFAASGQSGLQIRIAGCACMQPHPERAHVLYAPVHCDVLQRIADQLVAVFVERGLMRDERPGQQVTLHVTLINSRYRKDEKDVAEKAEIDGGGDVQRNRHRRRFVKRRPFDASGILERYAGYEFGTVAVREIHLSQMPRRATAATASTDEPAYYVADAVMTVA